MIIYGTKNEEILIDAEDFELVGSYKWNCYGGYARRFERNESTNFKLKGFPLHKMVIPDVPKGKVVDHINGNRLDNRKENLRICNTSQNSANRKVSKTSKSRFLGVTYHVRDERWQAQVRHKGKRYFCGYFKTELEAADAYNKKALQLHGEYARLNVL